MRKNKKIMCCAIFLLLLMCGLSFGIFFSSPTIIQNSEDFNNPKLSAGEITIITPENKTYTEPDSGYYPATYGFENDNNGDVPEGWRSWVTVNPDPKIISSMGTHNKVTEFRDQAVNGQTSLTQTFNENKTSGTIEVWFYTTDRTQRTRIFGRNSTQDYSFHIKVDSSKWQYNNGSTWKDVPNVTAPENNKWMHVRIDFECASGGYLGLGNDEYFITIDGIKSEKLLFEKKMDESDGFGLCSGVYATGFYFYIDSVGYSWNPNYNIGDNLYEGLLLSFENSTVLEWIGYSLDGQANRTILGNSTFPLPENGPHTIQMFGNNSLGTKYQSEIRYFTIDYPIEIITPESRTYSGAISGYYPATYGFEDVENGIDHPNWIDGKGTSQIIATLGDHNKVYLCGSSESVELGCIQNWESYQNYGTIELHINDQDATVGFQVVIKDEILDSSFNIRIRQDKFQYYNGTWNDIGKNASDDTWYHIRIDFETTTGGYMGLSDWTWRAFINGQEFGPFNFTNNYVPNTLQVYGELAISVRSWDAVGYSWDPFYNIGDNLNEGLLLSFENNTVLEWIGYSLDGQANRTILGNSTFPLPENGPHTIKVFGSDSLGTIFHSNIRHFLVDTIYPEIEIISPSQNEFFGSIAPNFEITLEELNLHFTWYSLDGGVTNITFSGLIGTIDQAEWDKKGDGSVIIRFYVNDTGGLESFAEIQVLKDTTDPIITDTPSDFSVEYGYTGVSLSWTATDPNPYTYTIELQGFGIVAGSSPWLNDTEITYNVPDGLAVGDYIYIVNFTDDAGNFMTDSVTMTVEDTTDPMLTNTPSNFTVDYGYTGKNIMWTATDPYPQTYTIELQGSGIVVGPTAWSSGVAIIYNIPDGLAVGEYIYTVNFTDINGNSVIHTVTLTVREVSNGGGAIPLELIIIISSTIGGAVVIAIAIVLLTRRRRKLT